MGKRNRIDWQAEAVDAASHAYEHLYEAHRGAFPWRLRGWSVAFGNDGYSSDPRPSLVVGALRQALAGSGIRELGFGLNPPDGEYSAPGYTWALVARTRDARALHEAVWQALARVIEAGEAGPSRGRGSWTQYSIASAVISHAPRPGPPA